MLTAFVIAAISPLINAVSYPLFHNLIELFCLIIAGCIGIITLDTRRFHKNNYLVFLGMTLLLTSVVDLLHLLSDQGVPIFPAGSADAPQHLWGAARSLHAVAWFISAWFIGRQIHTRYLSLWLLGGIAIVAMLLVLIWTNTWPSFPFTDQRIPAFLRSYECLAALFFLASLFAFQRSRQQLGHAVTNLLITSTLLFAAADLVLFKADHAGNSFTIAGLVLRCIAFLILYKAIIQPGLNTPYCQLVAQLKRSEEALRWERDFYSSVIDATSGLLVVLDTQGCILRMNAACEALTGWTLDAARGKPVWLVLYQSEEAESARVMFSDLSSGVFPGYHESQWVTREGERRHFAWLSTVIQGPDGGIQYVIGTGMDITAQKHTEENLQRLTLLDPLTGLYNRRGFMALAEQQMKLAERMSRRVLIIFVDVDHMKTINDEYGHLVGDEALVAIATALKDTFRDSDVIGRFGGDEFVVMAIEQSSLKEQDLTLRLYSNIETAQKSIQSPISLSVSLGIAEYRPETPCSLDALLERADAAMYAEKQLKRYEAAI